VFEVIEDDKEGSRAARPTGGGSGGGEELGGVSEAQVKALEALLEALKKKPA
jgi:hypothetical protein